VIFDSDVLIWFLRGHPDAAALVDSETGGSVSIVSVIEVLQGAKSKREMDEFNDYLHEKDLHIVPLSPAIGDLALALIEDYSLSTGLQLGDALIAATARETGQVLATANARHFRSIPRLKLKPFRPQRH
jgi:predicted nucleic acid-binding protein